ncbi:hypothetical protein [Acinetobacter terrae]|uniref:Lipoprotein n=1 Tax=Acinetobacter terrae TaxID=2731247 RepID=A0A4R0EMZ6_9GAMM|nr:hypothetical protein [Acinetobacter terrae]TCB59382.1 hypothetical protein E0H85_08490 [Acinetobacter terrae]
MGFIKSSLALALASLLVACGGGGSDGYYNNDSKSNTSPSAPDNTTSPTDVQTIFNSLKVEAASLFGQSNPEQKGYIDHALDTYAQSVLKITKDIRKLDFKSFNTTNRLDRCFPESKTDFRACYVFKGKEINNLLGSDYDSWDFIIDKGIDSTGIAYDDLANIRLKSDDIIPNLESYYGETYLLVFENENPLKNLQDITIAGAFSHPFQQAQGLQKRFILINEATSDFKITVTKSGQTTGTVMGALSIYKVPATSDNSEYYVTEAGSGFNTLINDNTNVAFAEPLNFRIDSKLGVTPSTYKILNGIETLNLPSVSISGTRIQHTTPSLNDKEYTGSIFLEGPNIFNFEQSAINSVLNFKHIINEITYEGTSTNTSSGIVTTFTSPSSIKY